MFVVGWGYYKLLSVQDDFSRKILAYDLRPDETAHSISDVVEKAIENAGAEGHLQDRQMPKLYLFVNWLPWSELNISGFEGERAFSSALMTVGLEAYVWTCRGRKNKHYKRTVDENRYSC